MKQDPKVGVGVIVKKDGKILMGKRKGAHGEGYRGFPGGNLEYGESFFECANREVTEEADIKIRNLKHFSTTNDVLIEDEKHYITIFISAEYHSGELKNCEPHKLEYWEWCNPNNLPEPLFLPIQNLLKQGIDL